LATPIRILGIAGSLRKHSYNKGALRAAQQLVPDNAMLEVFDIKDIPLYNQDLENQPPESVRQLKAKIRQADAILFVTPEYNYSVPGVLKNAIDWASRPYPDNSWGGKPVAVMGASIAMAGTARSQYHLRQSFVYLDMHPINKPEVMINNAASKFDAEGNLTDEETKKWIRQLLEALVGWAEYWDACKSATQQIKQPA
jgi:chromate reductase, NAD(P)H dehydrogenase (quinone)